MTLRHSMGGRALDRLIFDFEPDLDTSPDGGAADLSPDLGTGEPDSSAGATGQPQPPAGDLGEDGLPAGTPEPVAQPDWQTSPEFAQAVQQQTQAALEQWIAQAQQPEPEPEPTLELDPFADDYPQRLQQLIANTVQGLLGQQLAPLQPIVEQQQNAQAEQWANGLLDEIGVADDGTLDDDDGLDTRAAVLRASAGFMGYSPDGQPLTQPQQAIQQAADYIRQRDERVAAAAVAKFKQSLNDGGSTPYEPAGGFSATEAADLPASYDDVMNAVLSRTAA